MVNASSFIVHEVWKMMMVIEKEETKNKTGEGGDRSCFAIAFISLETL